MVDFDNIKIKDQLGRPEDMGLLVKRKEETIIIEEGPIKISTSTIGHSFILGHSTNGKLGSPYLGVDGQQIVLGEAGRVTIVGFIGNPGQVFKDYFYNTYFEDTSVTTADWGDTYGELDMTVGEIAQSLSISKNELYITKAILNATFSVGDSSDVTIQMTSNGGSNWETVTIGTEYSFTNVGLDLKFKITASDTCTITYINVIYS